ncbi:MAG: glutaredoxin [Candidatus Endonucleobacter sp. (ex Gigantidas childressi)]|nr:glutaredoxin [Candidatus Endonucleobacter sp. (ex Gigantidas childressi)]
MNAIKIVLFKWGGSWGPFAVRIPCGECAITEDVIHDVLKDELIGIPVELEVRDWLSCWWRPLVKGGWHAPIVMVENSVIFQGGALNRGLLAQAVIECYSRSMPIIGNHVFGKDNCSYCVRAKKYLDQVGIEYAYHDIIRDPLALYGMLGRVKTIIGKKVPVTVPQIWINGSYVGGADELERVVP